MQWKSRRITEQKSLLATLAPGKRTRLRRLLFEFGPGNGTLLLLPIDQGIEHGPRDFFPNPASKDPEYQFRLAAEAGYSAIACQIGMAEQVLPRLRRPGAADPQGQRQDRHPALRRGALAAATPRSRTRSGSAPTRSATRSTSARRARTRTCTSCKGVREDCDRFGMPLVIWAYPRGAAIEAKGGQNSFYAIDYAARMAMEMGADVVKLNMPKLDPDKDKDSPAPYNEMEVSQEEAIRQCVESAGPLARGALRRLEDRRRRRCSSRPATIMEAGGSGVIFGRNVWQREWTRGARDHRARSRRSCSPASAASRSGGARSDARRERGAVVPGVQERRIAGAPDAARACSSTCCSPAGDARRWLDGDGGRRAARQRAGGRPVTAQVVRVVDGDTIEVALDGGDEDVRYIGVDTPETVKPGEPVQCYGPRGARVQPRLVEGETVTPRLRRRAARRLRAPARLRLRRRPLRQRRARPRGLRAHADDPAQHVAARPARRGSSSAPASAAAASGAPADASDSRPVLATADLPVRASRDPDRRCRGTGGSDSLDWNHRRPECGRASISSRRHSSRSSWSSERRRFELRRRAANRSRARRIVKTEKRGKVRFSVLAICLTVTVVVVVVVMFETLAWLVGG